MVACNAVLSAVNTSTISSRASVLLTSVMWLCFHVSAALWAAASLVSRSLRRASCSSCPIAGDDGALMVGSGGGMSSSSSFAFPFDCECKLALEVWSVLWANVGC